MINKTIRRNMIKTGMAVMAFIMAMLMGVSTSTAASPIYMKNYSGSTANLSISTTNPATSGNIYSIKPGYAATGLCFYASASKVTKYWLGSSGTVITAKAGSWICPPYSNSQYTIRIY